MFSSSVCWRSHSDTETLLHLLIKYGVDQTLPLLNGMFAFSLWDSKHQLLYLARDRFGEKPLFYGQYHNKFFFGSQLNAFSAYPGFAPKLNYTSMVDYLRYGYIPDPLSIYQSFFKLKPSHYMVISPLSTDSIRQVPYWELQESCGQFLGYHGSLSSLADDLNDRLVRSVSSRLISDVPVASFLSGGVDSSLIAAISQSLSSDPINTFTIGFEDTKYDESSLARSFASVLRTNHHELVVSDSDILDLLPYIPSLWDEPFADSSCLPTLLVSRFISQQFKVSLSGDAGDELFSGYQRYSIGISLNRLRLLSPLLNLLYSPMDTLPFPALPYSLSNQSLLDVISKLKRAIDYLAQPSVPDSYSSLISTFQNPADHLLRDHGKTDLPPPFTDVQCLSLPDYMMLVDCLTYLPGDNLTKVDRASMKYGLEVRCPFLDHELAAWALSLPIKYKRNKGSSKTILKEVLARYIPRELFDVPKKGFSVPLRRWLRGPLSSWAQDSLSTPSVIATGVLNPTSVQTLLREFYNYDAPHHWKIWNLLVLQSWLNHNPHTL
jgi:asparagine synthase (glutamine-hydrolysing)